MLYDKRWDKKLDQPVKHPVLLDAIKLIEKHGWVQGKRGHANIGYCAVGAVVNSTMDYWASGKAITAMEKQVPYGVASWNDAPGRTKEEVIAMMRKAAMEEV
jgi:hypothetical protein